MGKLFGTDGIRGVANETLDAKLAYRVGQAAAISLCDDPGTKPTVVIGKDTRISSDMLEGALVAGLTACGCNAILLGVVPTPAVAYLTIYLHADAGVVISASHNPYEHNGIKMFSSEGFKLNDALEACIEELILQDGELPVKTHGEIGQVMSGSFAAEYYLDHLASTVDGLEPLRVLIDCANGASAVVAQKLFPRLGAKCTFLGISPDGENINKGVGSTHLDNLEKAVVAGGFDCGIAFDGDADRCLGCDEKGQEMDGDKIIALLAMTMKEKGRLDGDTAVVTVMSNLGFIKYMESQGINTEKTAVGDRYVLERMLADGAVIGGEQSGHIIFLEHNTTGDGLVTALQLLAVLKRTGRTLTDLAGIMKKYPQVLVNVHSDNKAGLDDCQPIWDAVAAAEKELDGRGRILVRPSGTEPLVRVMAEAETHELTQRVVDDIVEVVKRELP